MGKVEREEGIERDAREQSGRGQYLKDHALLSFYQTAKNSCSLMEEIAQMVERHFIVEVWIRSPLSFFIFTFGG
jgi:hypothetical protein